MELDCELCIQLVIHNNHVFSKRKERYKIIGATDAVPSIHPRSKLYWAPVIKMVCVFPIEEDFVISFENYNLFRPLFYSELDAKSIRELGRRLKLKKN